MLTSLKLPDPPTAPRGLGRLLSSALLCALLAARLGAQEEPRFLIEKISVSGQRRAATARIVVAESRLQEGQSYDERELRQAVYRIRRLPFIVDADFALRRGSQRGAYELAITIEQTTPLFLSYDLEGLYATSTSTGGRTLHAVDSGSIGVRQFVGAQGLVFASADKDLKSFAAGYTQYDLFGRGSFVSASVTRARHGGTTRPALSVGVPLTANQSLRTDLSWLQQDDQSAHLVSRLQQRDASLAWIYDTTDDPLFPGRGVKLSAGVFREEAGERSSFGPFVRHTQFQISGISLFAARHWPLTPRQSLSVALAATAVTSNRTVLDHGYDATLDLLHSVSLWGDERTRRFGDLRWETDLQENASRIQGSGLSRRSTRRTPRSTAGASRRPRRLSSACASSP